MRPEEPTVPCPAVPGKLKRIKMSETPLEYDAKENTKNIGKTALKLSDTVPKLEIEQYADGDLYALLGWDDLFYFGYLHSNTWEHAVDYAKHYGLQNDDLLKVLVRSLLAENLSLKEHLQEVEIRYGVPPGQMYSTKGSV